MHALTSNSLRTRVSKRLWLDVSPVSKYRGDYTKNELHYRYYSLILTAHWPLAGHIEAMNMISLWPKNNFRKLSHSQSPVRIRHRLQSFQVKNMARSSLTLILLVAVFARSGSATNPGFRTTITNKGLDYGEA